MQAGEPKPTPTGVSRAQSPAEQLEGLRAWTAQLDRRLGVRTIAGAIAIVLALAAGIVGVVLATSAKDESATKTDVTALGQEVKSVGRQAAQAAENDIADLSDRIDALEARVSTIASSQRTSDSELDVARDDIDELRGGHQRPAERRQLRELGRFRRRQRRRRLDRTACCKPSLS